MDRVVSGWLFTLALAFIAGWKNGRLAAGQY